MNFLPVHPALVHLPIAFILLSVVADFCARLVKTETRRAAFRAVGFWSLAAALVGGVLTIIAGYLDLDRATLSPETRDFVELHMTIGWILAVCLVILTAWRWLIWHRGQMTINTSYLIAAVLVLGITLFQGWYGGEMVYAYGAGVAPAGQGTESVQAARVPLVAVRNILEPGSAAVGGAESPGGTNIVPNVTGH
ncbi:MAG TPA: DUF2231 domain-containing protein [Candidatus Angelobacter sp.]|nr:DUF2231 domain-containing protein [Candidatus Angelobacter sp.]